MGDIGINATTAISSTDLKEQVKEQNIKEPMALQGASDRHDQGADDSGRAQNTSLKTANPWSW